MATLDWHHTRAGGVTLVELVVTTDYPASVRIESELTPVWPPRRQGVPAAGWEGNSFETTVAGEDRLVVGYASQVSTRLLRWVYGATAVGLVALLTLAAVLAHG